MQMASNQNKLCTNYLYPHPIVQITDSSNQNQQSLHIIQKNNEVKDEVKRTNDFDKKNEKQIKNLQEHFNKDKQQTFSLTKKIKNHQKYLTLYEEYQKQQKQNKNFEENNKIELNAINYSNYYGKKQIPIFSNKTIHKSSITNEQSKKAQAQNNLLFQIGNIKIQNKQYLSKKQNYKWIEPNNKSDIMIQILNGKCNVKHNRFNKISFSQKQNQIQKQTYDQNNEHNQNVLYLLGQAKLSKNISNFQHIQTRQIQPESEFNTIYSRQQSCHTTSTQSPSPWNSNFYTGYNSQKAYSGYFKTKSKAKFYKQKITKGQLAPSNFCKQKKQNKACNIRPKTCVVRNNTILNEINYNLKKSKNNLSVTMVKKLKTNTFSFNNIECDKQKQKCSKLFKNYPNLLFNGQLSMCFHRKNSKKGLKSNKQQNRQMQSIFISTLSGLQKQNQTKAKKIKESQLKKRNINKKVYFRQPFKNQQDGFKNYIDKKQNLQRSQRYWCDNQIEMDTQMFISSVKISKINIKRGVKYARQLYLTETLEEQQKNS